MYHFKCRSLGMQYEKRNLNYSLISKTILIKLKKYKINNKVIFKSFGQ